MVNDPDIVFLDEPTTDLDPKARREVWEMIKDHKAKGKTIILHALNGRGGGVPGPCGHHQRQD